MEHFDLITIVPTLHSNIINFMGMLTRDKYIAARRFQDKFVALDIKNRLTTWDVATGKVIGVHPLTNQDFSKYQIFKANDNDTTFQLGLNKGQVLLFKKEDEANVVEEDYFEEF